MKKLFGVLLFAPAVASAQQIYSSYWYGEDTDQNREHSVAVEGWQNITTASFFEANVGARVTQSRVSNRGQSQNTTDARVLGHVIFDNMWNLNYSIGVFDGAKTEMVGSVEGSLRTEKTLFALGVDRSGISSITGEQNGVRVGAHTYRTRYYTSAEYFGTRWGASGVGYVENFSDANTRRGIDSRVYYTVLPAAGVSVYVKTRHWRNSKPYTGNYYSPDQLDRYLAGVQVKYSVSDNVVLSGYADAGVQHVDSKTSRVRNWKVQIDRTHSNAVAYGAAVGVDSSANHSYRYKYATAFVNYRF